MSQPAHRIRLLAIVLLAWTTSVRADLSGDVRTALEQAKLGSATVAICIRDAATDTKLFGINDETPMIPASNMKLLTTGSALHVLGADFRFMTTLLRDGDRLVLVGDGDPALGDPDLLALMTHDGATGVDVETFLHLWTDPVVATGLTEIAELVIDARIFDDEYTHPTWPEDQLNRRYCAEVAGLNFHTNVLHFFPKPVPGQAPDLSAFTPYLSRFSPSNRGTSRTRTHDKNTAWIARARNSNDMTFYGNVKFAYQVPVPVTVANAPRWFGDLITDRLRRAGVTVRSMRFATRDEPAFTGDVLRRVDTPLTTVVTRCNRDSQNLYAEALLKRIGHELTREPGSWTNGGAILRHVVLQRLPNSGLASRLEVADGSGLSRDNRITAAMLTAWLDSFHRDPVLGPIFVESLAVGDESGTLEDRFDGVRLGDATVQAKTGYINEVSCLSGFVTMPDGRRRSFSVLVNGLKEPGSVGRAKRLQERVVAAIVNSLTPARAASVTGR